MVGRDVELAGPAGQQRARDDERYVYRLLVGHVPLLVHAAVGALHVAVVGAEDHDRVLVRVGLAQRVEHPRDLLADRGLHLVVELQVELDPRLRRDDLAPVVDVALLAGRLGREVLVVRRRLIDMRHLRRVVAQPLRQRDQAEHRVVVRVEKRAHRQPRRAGLFCIEALEQRDRLIGGERVLERAGVVRPEPVRLGADPLREAPVVEQIGLEVPLDVVLDRRAVIVDREQVPVAVLGVEVRVRGVPLALVERPVAAGAKPVAQRRHRVRRQPEHVVAVIVLSDSGGLRNAVQRRILAGQQRRAARGAGRRHRVVITERDAILP